MKNLRLMVVVPIALASVLAGCSKSGSSSSSDTIAKADFIAQADAICTSEDAKVKAVTPPGNPSDATAEDLSQWSDYFDQVLPIIKGEATKLTALPDPDTDKSLLDTWGTKFAASITAIDNLDTAAKAGNLADFQAGNDPATQADDAAKQAAADFGFKSCSQ